MKEDNKKIIAVVLVGIVVLIGSFFVINPGTIESRIQKNGVDPREYYTPYLEDITPDPDTDGDIHLNWNQVEGALLYRVYRCKLAVDSSHRTDFKLIATTQETEYDDLELSIGTYFYKIEVLKLDGSSSSNEQSVKIELPIPPSAPRIRVYIVNNYVKIECYIVEGADSYKIYRSYNGDEYAPIELEQLLRSPGSASIDYKDSGLDIGTYCYKIKAENEYGESDHSNEECIYIGQEIPNGDGDEIPEDLTGIIIILVFVGIGSTAVIYMIQKSQKRG